MSFKNSHTIEAGKRELDSLTEKYLTFYADSQLFGIPIADVVQIVGMQDIVAIPEYPIYAKGIINLRGAIIPVIDIRLRMNKPEIPYNERTCTSVTNMNHTQVGFIADGVDEVAEIDNDNISPPPKMSSDLTNYFVTGIANLGDKVVLLLDISKLLYGDDIVN